MPLINIATLDGLLRAFLESRIDDLNGNLMLFTGAVVVGLFLEYAPDFLEKAATSGANWGFRHVPVAVRKSKAWHPRWMNRLEVLGAILVVSGVSGELYTEFNRSTIEAALRNVNGSLLAFMQQQSSEANVEAARATATGKGFESQLAASNARTKVAEAQIAEAQSMAKSSDLARVQLEARIAPRTLTVIQRESIGRTLSPFARQFLGRRIRLDWSIQDLESTIFAVEVEDSIKRAGIDVERANNLNLNGTFNVGVAIRGPVMDAPFVKTVYDILHEDFPKESMGAIANPQYNGSPVTITIGFKPPQGLDTLPLPSAVKPP